MNLNLFRLFTVRKLRSEMVMVKPIYSAIFDDDLLKYQELWNTLRSNCKLLEQHTEEIEWIDDYTTIRLKELANYISGIKTRRTKRSLSFYEQYLETLQRYLNNKLNQKNILQYMYLYNELILGSTRYIRIKEELEKLGSKVKEDGSIT